MVDEASGRPEDSGEPKPPVKLYKYTVGGYFSGKTKTPFAITQGHKETLEWHVPADRFENGEDIDCDGGDYYMQLCSEARPMPGPAGPLYRAGTTVAVPSDPGILGLLQRHCIPAAPGGWRQGRGNGPRC